MHVPHNALVLVADGRKMLFLRNRGDAAIADLRVEEHHEQDNPATRDQGTDQPGRSSSPAGSRKSSVEATDFHQIAEDRFAAEAASILKNRALAGDFESLIVIAPPTTLGEIRKNYHQEVKSRLIGEVDKDLTGHTVAQIEKALAG
jgi:protein required for attachment to host cells